MPRHFAQRHVLHTCISRRGVMATAGLLLASSVISLAGPAVAQGQPGDAAFCRQYAATVATAAEDAIALNLACLSQSTGVHGDRKMHVDWCARTPREKVEGAAVHIRRLASRCTQGALVVPTEYGGYDIVGHEHFERPYGRARQWDVKAAFSGRTFMYCVADWTGKDRPVRLGVDLAMPGEGTQWQLAVPMKSKKDWQGTLRVDGRGSGRGSGNGGGVQTSGTAIDAWTIAWLGMAEVDSMRKGRAAILGIGTLDYDFSLEGVAAAILKLEECRSRKGASR